MHEVKEKILLKYATGIFTDLSEIGERIVEERVIRMRIGLTDASPVMLNIQANEPNAKYRYEIEVEDKVVVVIVEQMEVKEYLEATVNLKLGSNAKVHYIAYQNTPSNVYSIIQRTADVEQDAQLTWCDIELGGKIVKSDIETRLVGEGAEGRIYGLFFGNDNQVFDIHHIAYHIAPQTSSSIETKGVLTGKSKTVYRGLIKIDPGAKKSKGFEREDTLVLSNDAQISAIPDLEIGNNDVQCSHAVTTTNVDKEKLFYLTSRGIAPEDAIQLCVQGHFASVLDKISDTEVKEKIHSIVLEKLYGHTKD